MTSESRPTAPTPLPALAVLGLAVGGGLLAAPPLLVAGMAAAYLRAWLGLGTIDPTWNDGDGGLVLAAVAVVALLLTAVAASSVAIARRRGLTPGVAAALAVAVAVATAVLASSAVLPST